MTIVLISNLFFAQKDSLTMSDIKNGLVKEIKSDTLYKANYPEGIYLSKKEFMNRKPNSTELVVMKGFNKKTVDSIIHNPYFYYSNNNKKVKKVFAISYKGHLYFQIKAILKNRNKTDRAQSTNFHNTFARVILGGKNYLYTEAELVNQWAYGTAMNFGIAGGIIADELIESKGIVWDYENKEFNIFKSCKDYNRFITNKLPEGVQECDEHSPNLFEIREALDKIK